MTTKTKYSIGDKIDLGLYVNGEGAFEVYRVYIDAYRDEPLEVTYHMQGFREIRFTEYESGEKLLNIKLK